MFDLPSWLQSLRGGLVRTYRHPPRRRPRRCTLRVEALEERATPDSGGATGQLAGQNVVYGGGPLIPNVNVQPIFLHDTGSGQITPLATRTSLTSFLSYIATGSSPYLQTLLSPYSIGGQNIGSGAVGNPDVNANVTSNSSVGATPALTDALIQTAINTEIAAGRTAAANPDNLYVVFAPPGDAVVTPTGNSVSNFHGYHSAFVDGNGKTDYYAVIADPGVNANYFALGLTALQDLTAVVSHEFAEAITDPDVPPGWQNPSTGSAGEIADQAVQDFYTQDNWVVSYLWSNAAGGPAHAFGTSSPNLFINQLTPPAVAGITASIPVATFTDPDGSLNATSFTATVYSVDSNGVASPNWGTSISGGAGGVYVVNAKPPSATVAGQVGNLFQAQGLNVQIYDQAHGGPNSGAPLSLKNSTYLVAASAPLNYTGDNGGTAHNFVLNENGPNLVLSDNGQTVFVQPLAATTGINLGAEPGASNSLTIDYSGGQFELPISFDGGTGNGPHNLTVTGGSFTGISDLMTSGTNGTLALTDSNGTFNLGYTNLNSVVNLTPGSLGNLAFTLPKGGGGVTLQDDATPGNGIAKLVNLVKTFPAFGFLVPSSALTINTGSGYTTTLSGLDSQFNSSLTINDGGAGNNTINVNTALNLGTGGAAGNVTLDGGTIKLNNPINAGNGGSVNIADSTGLTIAAGATIGADGSIQVTGPGAINLGAALTSNFGAIALAGPTTLQTSLTLTGSSVAFGSSVDGAAGTETLTLPGNASFAGNVGATQPLASLAVAGTVALGGNVVTNLGQQYSAAATLTGNDALKSLSGGAISFGGTIDGAFNLAVNTGGATTFSGAIGGATPLAGLSTDAPGTTLLPATVATSGAQTFNDTVNFAAATTNLTAGSLGFTGAVNLNTNTVNVAGSLTFSAAATLVAQINGGSPNLYGHITHTGGADLGNAGLSVTRQNSYIPNIGTVFDLLGINGSGALVNTFNGQPEGSFVGLNGVTAQVSYQGGSGKDFALTIKDAPPAKVAFLQQPSAVVAGNPISPAVKVAVEDAVGDVLTSNSSTITLSIASGPNNGTLGGTVSAQAVNGVATFSNLILTIAGTYTLKAVDGMLGPDTSMAFAVTAGAPDHLKFEAAVPNVTAGPSDLGTLNVDIADQYGNVINSSGSTVSITAVGPGAFVPTTLSATTNAGVATFSNVTLTRAGTYTIGASTNAGGVANGSSNSFTVSAAAASQFFFEATLADVTAGTALPAFNVDVTDAFGNVVTTNSTTVSIQPGASSPGSFTAGAATSVPAVKGVATFSGLTLTVAGPYTLVASGAGLPNHASNKFNVTPAAPDHLFFPVAIGNYTAGTTLNDVTVDVLDTYNNLTGANGLTINLAPAGPQNTFNTGPNSATTANGQATFSGLSLQKAGSYTLSAAATNLTAAASGAFTINPAAPYQLVLASTPPATITAGNTLPPVQINVDDQYFNPVPTATGPIHLDAVGPVTVGADSTVAQGSAQFSNVVLTTAGDYQLNITAPNLLPVSSGTITVTPAAPFQVVITAGPADKAADQTQPTIEARIEDKYGNLINSGDKLAIGANGPGTFPAGTPTTATASGGVADFSGLVLHQAGNYTLTVSDSSAALQPGTSSPFTISPAGATQLVFEANPGNNTAGNPLPALKVDLEDPYGNLVPGNPTVGLNAIGPGPLSGSTTTVANHGVATFNGLTLDTSGDYQLQASAPGVSSALTKLFTINPAAPAALTFEANPPDVTAGKTVGPVSVDVKDSFGNPVSGVPVKISASGPGSFSAGTLTQTSAAGVATFGDLVLTTAGSYTLTAAASGVSNVTTGSFLVNPAAASQLAVTTAVPDTVAGVPLPDVKVAIEDAFGNLVPTASATVALAASGPGSFSAGPTSASTSGGVATFHGDKITTAGSYALAASATNLASGKSAGFHITPAAASQLTLTAQPGGGTAGKALPDLDVNVLDTFGNPIGGASVSLTVNGPGSLSAGNTSATSAANGVAVFTGLTLPTAGSYTVTATAGTLGLTSNAFTISPAAPSALAFSVEPANGTAGAALPDVLVQVEDAFGNLVNNNAAITLSVAGPGALSAGNASATATGGVADFTGLTFKTAGSYTLAVSATGLTGATSTVFTIGAGAATQVNFEAVPASAVAGTALPDLKVDVEDAFGNRVAGAGGAVKLTVNGPAGLSGGPSSANAVNGTALFSGLTLNTAGTYTLTASLTGLQSNTSGNLSVKAAAAAQLAFQTAISGASAGQPIGNVVVAVQDAFGNPVTAPNFNVTLAFTGPANPGGSSATVASAGGVATFAGLTLQTAGVYALSAGAPGLATATAASFTVSAGPATQIGFDASPVNVSAGQAQPAFAVNVTDAFGNPVTGTVVTLTVNGPGNPVAGATTATSLNGAATFNGLTLQMAGSYTLTARTTGLQPVTSSAFLVTPAPASHLAFAVNPGNVIAGQPLPDVHVLLLDAFGNQASASGVAVTLSTTGPLTVGGTATSAQGLATFSNLLLKVAGTYTLSASAPGLTATTTPAFAVLPAAASQLVFETSPTDTPAGQALATFKVDIQDAFGNIVVGSAAAVTVSATGPGGFAAGATTTANPAGGVATFSGLVLQKAGSYTLGVGAAGLAAATSAVFNIVAGPVSQLVFEPLPASAGAGQPLPDVKVDLLDPYGNPTGSNAPITLGVSGPGAPAAGNLTTPAQNGVATFSGLILPKSGGYTFTAGGVGLPSATSPATTINPGAPAQLVFEPLPANASAGATLPPIKVDVLDAFGNLTGGSTPVALVLSGSAVPNGTSVTVAASNGVATFSGLVLPASGGYTLLASAPGVAAAGSGSFTATAPATGGGSTGGVVVPPIVITLPPIPSNNGGGTTTAGKAARVRFLLASIRGVAGHALPAIVVQVLDAHQHPVRAGTVVQLRLKSGKLRGKTKLVTDKNGLVTFKGLAVAAHGQYTLLASTPDLSRVTPIRLSVAAVAGPGRRN